MEAQDLLGRNAGTSYDASSVRDARFAADLAFDGDWISRWQAKDQREGAWVRATFASRQHLGAVILVDRANEKGLVRAVRLEFSDGTALDYRLPVSQDPSLPQNGLLWRPLDSGPAPVTPKNPIWTPNHHEVATNAPVWPRACSQIAAASSRHSLLAIQLRDSSNGGVSRLSTIPLQIRSILGGGFPSGVHRTANANPTRRAPGEPRPQETVD
jgi:hypothetical protein